MLEFAKARMDAKFKSYSDQSWFEHANKWVTAKSYFGINVQGQRYLDKYCMWFLFSLAFFLVIFIAFLVNLVDLGTVTGYVSTRVPFT